MKLLSRDEFRNAVFERDGHKCVICGKGPKDGILIDAHHIIERRLWSDGGYYIENGATLCDRYADMGSIGSLMGCHMAAETTFITVETIREKAGISKAIIPEDMYDDLVYDKWGNTILPDGRRTRGPLMNDESVKSVLKMYGSVALHRTGDYISDPRIEFVEYVKYPRTYHLPWSPGKTEDDRTMQDLSVFEGKRVIVTRKMDGENFSGYKTYSHARSIDGRSHETRDWAKNFWNQRSYELPEGWRVCAENLYAVHSIKYVALPSYLLGVSIWNERNECLSWDETVEWFELLDIPTVEVLYDGIWDEKIIKSLYNEKTDINTHEGYVVRIADGFEYRNFKTSVAKYVRKNHVATNAHWFYGSHNHDANGLMK